MTIYIENAIIDNMVINSLLLYFVFRTIKQKPNKWLIMLSALVGTGFALVMPLLTFSGILAVLVRLFIGALMVYIVQHKSLKRFVLFYLIFLAYTFAFGGAVFGVLYMINDTQSGLQYFTYNSSVSVGLVIGVVAGMALLMRLLIKFLNVRHSISSNLRDIVIHHRGEQYKILSYLDTGNRLRDPESDAPVVVISLSLFLKMFPDISADRILLNKLSEEGIEEGRYINFSTVAGKSKMFTFAPNKLEIVKGKTHEKVRLGVSMKGFKDAVRYDALLNAELG